jgi:uncharacterized membrane protein
MPRPTAKNLKVNDDNYLRIWDIEQKHTNTRWTLMTFYLSVSFAIFGLSFQTRDLGVPLFVPLSVAVGIYWFAYFLFKRFHDFNEYLRSKLAQLEKEGKTSLHLQTESKQYLQRDKKLSATKMVFIFGILYTIAGIVISLFSYWNVKP